MTTSQINQTQLERDVLAAIMIPSSKVAPVAMVDLQPEYFQMPQHRLIYRAICNLFNRQQQVDLVSVTEELIRMGKLEDAGGRFYISDILCQASSLVDHLSPVYVDFLIERYKGLEMTRLIGELTDLAENETEADSLMHACRQKLDKLQQLKKADKPQPVGELANLLDDHLDTIARLGELPSIKCHYADVDRITNGFLADQFILIAARPGNCKTSIALNFAVEMAKAHKRVLFYSLEMSKFQINMRLYSLVARVNYQTLLKGKLTAEEQARVEQAKKGIAKLDIHISDEPVVSVHTVNAHAEIAEKSGKPYDIIIVDYLQLMKTRQRKDDNKNNEVSELSRGLKLLAKERKVPVIALSQLNRAVELRQDKRPQLSDLRDSGSLEQDADLVFGLFREEYYNKNTDRKGDLEVICLKNRHGDTGTAYLRFHHGTCAILER